MASQALHRTIKSLLEDNSFLTHVDIAKKLKKDKAKISGYLQAMADYGEISMKRVGNSKVYFIDNRGR